MKLSGSIYVFSAALACAAVVRGATDYTRRNEVFSPTARALPENPRRPAAERAALPDRRVTYPMVQKEPAALAARAAAVVVAETSPKKVLAPVSDAQHPAIRTPELSSLNHQPSRLSTDAARRPELVARFQDKLAPAQAVSIGRTPSLDRRGEARLNRFVFRHNGPAPLPAPAASASLSTEASSLR